jgi:putative RecB family exonuclease
LDRIDVLKDGRFHIVDYKTNKNPKFLDPFQLLVYGLWLKQEYPNVESFKASFILLRHKSTRKEYEFNLRDLNEARKKIIKFAEQINASNLGNNWMPIPNHLCNWCDYKNICPAQTAW